MSQGQVETDCLEDLSQIAVLSKFDDNPFRNKNSYYKH